MDFPRFRRTRKNAWTRDLLAEYKISPSDLIQPFFIVDGVDIQTPIPSIEGQYSLSFDKAASAIAQAQALGIKMVALFPSISPELKDDQGSYAFHQNNYFVKGLKALKSKFPDIGFMVDVALDPYTSHGHDGVLDKDGNVDNDKTVELLAKYSLLLADSGVEVLAPSDMMDGRVQEIRYQLDQHNFQSTMICSYSAKFCSNFYGPFRAAVGSKTLGSSIDKSSYQLDYRSSKEALKEIAQDISEEADMIIIKPGLPYLDIIKQASEFSELPIFAYHVSGEFAMLKLAANAGYLDFNQAYEEILIAFKRAGATGIITYGALDYLS